MEDVTWIKIDAWHAIRTATRGGDWLTVCGERVGKDAEQSDSLPAEKSCELCLRMLAWEDGSG